MKGAPRAFEMPEFFAPLPAATVALFVLNDHLLKARFHNVVTGKLSDLTGCFFLPLFVSALLGFLGRWPLRTRLKGGAALTAIVFTVFELSDGVDTWWLRKLVWLGSWFGHPRAVMTRDWTDLLALIVIPVAYLYGCWRGERACRRLSGSATDEMTMLRTESEGRAS